VERVTARTKREVFMRPFKGAMLAMHATLSLVLSLLTLLAIGAIDRLPYSPIRDSISDALKYPGALVSSPLYPEGIHTGTGSPRWVYAAVGGNLLFYAVVWFLIMLLIGKRHSRTSEPE
jgi:hypothetical protein